ncbi:MAG TPA: tripartite tricarboxylate transporter substrate binding protein [Burkholderiales bacterium]|nr:tripartite tricarboxylate transporter substrate binding protein [Burkholderiales bacterium]
MNRVNRTVASWLTLAGICAAASAQDKPPDYPTRPIRLVVAASAGAGGDMMARAVAQMLVDAWGQNTIVDNRPGASGTIAVELVARSAPDGYTLLSLGDTLIILGATKRVSIDVLKSFEPVTPTSVQPYIILAHASLPAKSIKELVAHSAARGVTYSGSTGVGAAVHLGMERFAQLSGAKLQFVPYKGTAPAIVAAMGGEIQMAVASTLSATPAMRSGKLRGLAALSLTRVPSMPDLPTVAEQGYPDFKIINRYGLQAPAGTPRRIVDALNRVVSDGFYSPQMMQRLVADGSQPAERMTPAQFKAALARDYTEVEQQVKRLNIKLE